MGELLKLPYRPDTVFQLKRQGHTVKEISGILSVSRGKIRRVLQGLE